MEKECLISVYSLLSLSAAVKKNPGLLLCVVCYGLSNLCLHSSGFNTLSVIFFSELCYRSLCKRYCDQNSVVSEEVITN